jgi:hypothetical protein
MPLAAVGFLAFFCLERYAAMHGSHEHVHATTTHKLEREYRTQRRRPCSSDGARLNRLQILGCI